MKQIKRIVVASGAALAVVAGLCAQTTAVIAPPPLPPGATLPVVMQSTLCSDSVHAGDTFFAAPAQPVTLGFDAASPTRTLTLTSTHEAPVIWRNSAVPLEVFPAIAPQQAASSIRR